MTIRPITAAETRPIRQRVLRPHQRASELVFDGDDDPSAGHYGAFVGGELVGIASVFEQGRDGASGEWRLRGMAVLPEHAGRGLGRALLDATLRHARAAGGAVCWCNARTTAAGFYLRYGMRRIGDEFELPGVGPHVVMERALRTDGRLGSTQD